MHKTIIATMIFTNNMKWLALASKSQIMTTIRTRKNNCAHSHLSIFLENIGRSQRCVSCCISIGEGKRAHVRESWTPTFLTLSAVIGISSAFMNETSSEGKILTRNFIADAVEKALPGVVNITVEAEGGFTRATSSGSGFIVDKNGTCITNAHVVSNCTPSTPLSIILHDGTKYNGRLHSMDVLSDIAIVEIVGSESENFPVIKIGTSETLRAGEWVIALGSPLTLQNSVSAGIVSAVARCSSELGMSQRRGEFIQTDAAINFGNSGGPLINLDGEVIGINSMKVASGSGISFAIPVDMAIEVVNQLRKSKRVERPYIGMQMMTINFHGKNERSELARIYPNLKKGVIVRHIESDSPAHKGGLEVGDVIVEFDGESVSNTKDILSRLGFNIGKKIPVVIYRNGKKTPQTLYITTEKLKKGEFVRRSLW